MLRAATYGRGVFEFVKPTWPAIAVNPQNGLAFGTVCSGPSFLTLQIFNVGAGDLVVTSVQRLMGSTGFRVLAFPGTPLVIKEGEEVDFSVEVRADADRDPGGRDDAGSSRTTPEVLILDLMATGAKGAPALVVAVPDQGEFGDVCLDYSWTADSSSAIAVPVRCASRTSSHRHPPSKCPACRSTPSSWRPAPRWSCPSGSGRRRSV